MTLPLIDPTIFDIAAAMDPNTSEVEWIAMLMNKAAGLPVYFH